MPNDKAFEDGQQLLKLKQTETTLAYISDFRALASGVRNRQPYTGWAPMRGAAEKLATLRSCWVGCHSKQKSVLRKMTGQGVQMPQSGESARIGCTKEKYHKFALEEQMPRHTFSYYITLMHRREKD